MKPRLQSAFTLIEMLVVISIIALLAALAVPAISSALVKGQQTGTMNNARQLFLAGQQMALDGAANSDPNLAFPGDYNGAAGSTNAPITKLSEYLSKLVQNNYLQTGDVQKLVNAPGASCTATGGTTAADGTFTPITLSGNPALKVYKILDANSANTIFAVSANYTYNSQLTATTGTGPNVPYGDKGFIVQRKGGDASIFKKNQATAATATGGDPGKFQALVGKLVGDTDGTLGTEGSTLFLSAN